MKNCESTNDCVLVNFLCKFWKCVHYHNNFSKFPISPFKNIFLSFNVFYFLCPFLCCFRVFLQCCLRWYIFFFSVFNQSFYYSSTPYLILLIIFLYNLNKFYMSVLLVSLILLFINAIISNSTRKKIVFKNTSIILY